MAYNPWNLSTSNTIKAPRTRGMGGVNYEVEFIGDWTKMMAMLDGVPLCIQVGAIAGQESAANKLIKIVKAMIRAEGYGHWPSLSASTLEKKAGAGGMYNWTGTYIQSIKKWRKAGKVYVGVERGVRHPKSRITIGQIANILEYGSSVRGIPSRPLWTPSFQKLGGNKRIKALITWHIAKQFRTRYGISPKFSLV